MARKRSRAFTSPTAPLLTGAEAKSKCPCFQLKLALDKGGPVSRIFIRRHL